MGAAKRRGTREQRVARAKLRDYKLARAKTLAEEARRAALTQDERDDEDRTDADRRFAYQEFMRIAAMCGEFPYHTR